MAGSTTRITGLWAKDTKAGRVLSAALKPDARAALIEALQGDALLEVVVFENNKRDRDTSPTHNLCIAVQGPRYAGTASRDDDAPVRGSQAKPEAPASLPAEPSSGQGDLLAPKWPTEKKPVIDDTIPF